MTALTTLTLGVAWLSLIATILTVVFADGLARRIDRLTDRVNLCERAIATSRHVAYDDTDHTFKTRSLTDDEA